jgi:hypothetical protein
VELFTLGWPWQQAHYGGEYLLGNHKKRIH